MYVPSALTAPRSRLTNAAHTNQRIHSGSATHLPPSNLSNSWRRKRVNSWKGGRLRGSSLLNIIFLLILNTLIWCAVQDYDVNWIMELCYIRNRFQKIYVEFVKQDIVERVQSFAGTHNTHRNMIVLKKLYLPADLRSLRRGALGKSKLRGGKLSSTNTCFLWMAFLHGSSTCWWLSTHPRPQLQDLTGAMLAWSTPIMTDTVGPIPFMAC